MKRLEINGADPLWIIIAIVLGFAHSWLWLLLVPLIVFSWYVRHRWSSDQGWRIWH